MGRAYLKASRFWWNTVRETFDGIMWLSHNARWFAVSKSRSITEKLETPDNDR